MVGSTQYGFWICAAAFKLAIHARSKKMALRGGGGGKKREIHGAENEFRLLLQIYRLFLQKQQHNKKIIYGD
ncbi:MAG: hypothetical protein EAZ89_04975 [Bacteroidetes bacterium]|nr:MAG: hypothetical protein EAZ89_04975 [Bacteroidota bacterium]